MSQLNVRSNLCVTLVLRFSVGISRVFNKWQPLELRQVGIALLLTF